MSLSPDELAFFEAIRANSPDNLPRLVYADFLEERGDESSIARAEFIRSQCELTTHIREEDRRERLNARVQELLAVHRETWDAEVRERLLREFPNLTFGEGQAVESWRYSRGMVASVTVKLQTLHDHPTLLSHLGPVEHLAMTKTDDWHILRAPDTPNGPPPIDYSKLRMLSMDCSRLSPFELLSTFLTQPPVKGFRKVPVLELTAMNFNPEGFPSVFPRQSSADMLCPVVMTSNLNRVHVSDPFELWPLVQPWAHRWSTFLRRHPNPELIRGPLTDAQQRELPSLRLSHLVRYYRLAGLPPPSNLPAPPKPDVVAAPPRGIFNRLTRWFQER